MDTNTRIGILSAIIAFGLAGTSIGQETLAPAVDLRISGNVEFVEPFTYTDGMDRVTALTVVVYREEHLATRVRVFCIGNFASLRCSRLRQMDVVEIFGTLAPVTIVDLIAGGTLETHEAYPAVYDSKMVVKY